VLAPEILVVEHMNLLFEHGVMGVHFTVCEVAHDFLDVRGAVDLFLSVLVFLTAIQHVNADSELLLDSLLPQTFPPTEVVTPFREFLDENNEVSALLVSEVVVTQVQDFDAGVLLHAPEQVLEVLTLVQVSAST
jgi:hypothetical protein